MVLLQPYAICHFQVAPDAAASSNLMTNCRCAKGSDGLLHIQVKDEGCIQAIKTCFAPGKVGQVFNLVQQTGWGQTPFAHPDQASDGSDVDDCPGSWSSHTVQKGRQLHPEGNMAYPMRVGCILRPVPGIEASSPVEVGNWLCTSCHCHAFAASKFTDSPGNK